MQDVEFIDEKAENNELFALRPNRERQPGWITPFLVKRKWVADEGAAFKALIWASVVLFVLAALIFSWYGYGVDQFKSVPTVPKISSGI